MRRYILLLSGLLLSLMTLTVAAQENLSPQGCRRGTPRPESMYLSRGASKDRTPGGNFYHGERHQLTVLVAFNDRSFAGDKDATLVQWNKIFNAEKLTEEPFKGSVHDYFLDQSYGEFNVVFDLTYVQVGDDAKKYASTYSDDENSQYLVQDIMEILKQDPDIDWGKYDWNGDGYINQLLIIYAGQGMNDYNPTEYTEMIWAHQWWMSEHLKDNQEDVYCEPIPVSSGGKDYLVDCYCALAEMGENNTYSTFGTICHEYTHCFGFPDFYYNGVKTLDQWDLMDSGNFNAGGFIPPGYSAHERWVMGWLTPIELKEETTITDMPALTDEGRAYLVRNDGYENEYYIVENRQPKGWDAGLPGSGILVFHIDYDPAVWASSSVYTNTEDIMRYDLFHANEKYDEGGDAGWAYPYQDNDKLTNTSIPTAILNKKNSKGTYYMSKPITNMEVTDGLASFDFTVSPISTGLATPPESATVEKWYTVSGELNVNTSSGTQTRKPTIQVAIDGTDIYIQGLAFWFEKGWIKGTISGNTATFANGQLVGEDEIDSEYICGTNDQQTLTDIVFEYDAEKGILAAVTAFIIESNTTTSVNPYCYWTKPTFSRTEPIDSRLVVAPENLVTEEWAINAKDTYDDPVSGYLNIGFDGNDVYLQGLCAELPKAWIKGTLDGTTITFAGDQYLGVYDGGQFFYYEFFLCHEGATFTYDAAAGKLTAEGEIYIYTGGSNLKADVYINPVISKVVEKAATPAMPDISEIYDSFTGPIVFFTIPTVDVNGDAMASSKLEFQFLKEVDQEITPVTFSPDNYLNLPVPMDIIPYGFTDDADFFDIYIYFKQPDFNTWKKIGLQAIYNGAGECHKSDIFWMENPFFTNGISEVMPDMKSDKTLIFNLAGQRLTAPRKGLNIINGKKVMVK